MAKKNTKTKKETQVIEEVVETIATEKATEVVEETTEVVEEPITKEEEPQVEEIIDVAKEVVAIEEIVKPNKLETATKRNVDEGEPFAITPLKAFNPKTKLRKKVKMNFEGWNGTYID